MKHMRTETYQLIQQLKLTRMNIRFATPYPGTVMYKECVDNRLIEKSATLLSNENFYYNSESPHFKSYKLEKHDLIDFRHKLYKEMGMQYYLKIMK